jgi:hypothetical protein
MRRGEAPRPEIVRAAELMVLRAAVLEAGADRRGVARPLLLRTMQRMTTPKTTDPLQALLEPVAVD